MKLYVRLVDLELHFWNTLSNAKMSYVWNVYLAEWNKLCIHDFSSWGRIGFQNVCVAVEIWNFKIWVVQTVSDEKLTITHNVYLDELDKLCIHDFCIWDYQGSVKVTFQKKNPRFDLVKLGQTRH